MTNVICGMSPSCKGRVTCAYKNTKEELHRASVAIYFNKMCQLNHETPNYIKITISGHHQQYYKAKAIMLIRLRRRSFTEPIVLFGLIKCFGLNHLLSNYIRITISGNNWQCYKAMYNICYALELITNLYL